MSEKRIYSPKCGMKPGEWAVQEAFTLWQSPTGPKSKGYFHRLFVREDGKPCYAEDTWADHIERFRNGAYERDLQRKKKKEGSLKKLIETKRDFLKHVLFFNMNVDHELVTKLLQREDPETPGVAKIDSLNGKTQTWLKVGSGFNSNGSKYRRLDELNNLLDVQGAGDFDSAFIQQLEFKRKRDLAIQHLSIKGQLGPEDSLDFKITFGFTDEQYRGLKQAGLGLASFEEIKEVQKRRQIPLVTEMLELEITKPRDKEIHTTRDVRQQRNQILNPNPPRIRENVLKKNNNTGKDICSKKSNNH